MGLMTVSPQFCGKGIGQLDHDIISFLTILQAVIAMPQKAIKIICDSHCCSDEVDIYVQSGLETGIDTTPTDTPEDSVQQNVSFIDGENDVVSSIPHPMAYTKVDCSQNVDLGDFLQRPVQVYSDTWQIGTHLSAATSTFRPWHDFFNHASIKKKLDNYYMVRCNLHLKFVINASPFYYGSCLVAYQPLTDYTPGLIVPSTSGRLENVLLSQRPHIYLYPQNSQGGEMVLPFLYYKNWLDATSASDLDAMGVIDFNSLTVLRNANGLTTDTISIVVYAWAEDLEVAGPTIALSVQSGKQKVKKKDEYSHEGSISKPASAIARAANSLSNIPVIGPFATATSYAAGAIGDIASLFGYTDVPVIDDVHAFRSKPYPNLCNTDIGTPIEKLTLDNKNELSIDPKIAGVDVEDELTISSICQRESYGYSSTWASTDAIDTSLLFLKITPQLRRTEGVTNATLIYSTPMDHVAEMFQFWRGDIIVKLKFICSAYHRGRVRVNWDPKGAVGVSGDYTTETYTRVIDITQETEVEIRIPYTQPTGYLSTTSYTGSQFAKSGTSTSSLGVYYNGTLTVRVLNEQTSPVSSADIEMLVFVRGAENLEFAGPKDILNTYSPYTVQSGMQFDTSVDETSIGLKPSVADENINLIYMGEHCVSLRQLMRRSVLYKRLITTNNTSTEYFTDTIFKIGRQPIYPGYDFNGLDTALGLTSGTPYGYNWVPWNAVTWFSMCFVGSRGSYHYTLNPAYSVNVSDVRIARLPNSRTTYMASSVFLPVTDRDDFVRETVTDSAGLSGLVLTNQRSQAGHMISAPMYSRYKFQNNSTALRTDGSSIDDTNIDSLEISAIYNSQAGQNSKFFYADLYMSSGTDFSLIFFLNVPTLYLYDSLPLAS
jgi:hypothetical protein